MAELMWPNPESPKPINVFDRSALKKMQREYSDGKLPLNITQQVLKDLKVTAHKDSWVSSAKRGDAAVLNIGLEAVPSDTVKRWGWGVTEAADQVHIKASHEYAHFIQDFFDRDLARFLDNKISEIGEHSHSYIELYAFLTQTGRISGLPEETIYKQQTETLKGQGSLLDMQVYEDIAEVIGAWMLGEAYYNFRLDNSKTQLTTAQRNQLTGHIEKTFEVWAIRKSQERS